MPQDHASAIHIETFTLGDWMTNCYVLVDSATRACWIVDAGFDPEPMVQYVRDQKLDVQRILLTHGHIDHLAGLDIVRQAASDVPVLIHSAEETAPTDPQVNLSAQLDTPLTVQPVTGALNEDDELTLGSATFKVLHTPGHSPGGVTLFAEDQGIALTGDALFAGSAGRTDLPGSDHHALMRSLAEKLMTLPETTQIYPGHGPSSTIGQEKRSNPFVQ